MGVRLKPAPNRQRDAGVRAGTTPTPTMHAGLLFHYGRLRRVEINLIEQAWEREAAKFVLGFLIETRLCGGRRRRRACFPIAHSGKAQWSSGLTGQRYSQSNRK
jgi:hypothetical protein